MGTEAPILDVMEGRLLDWAAWLKGGDGGNGYPVTNVLHKSWLPPTPGQTPTMATGGRSYARERALHDAVAVLSPRLQHTLAVVYVYRLPVEEQVLRLQCEAGTVRARVADAKRSLWVKVQQCE